MGGAGPVLVVCLALVLLSVWLPVTGARRWVPAPWRPFAASVGSALIVALAVWFAVLSVTA
ncbi:MAG TPA: hypothetical protein VFL10_13130, partial [Ornithinibacter sp.]|nr:hypothetical protein [Ornithinibacter sp.]